MNNLYVQSAKQIIENVKYAAVATVDSAGQPWNSPVFVATDGQRNFYWTSPRDAQHSRNIAANPKVCLVIYSSEAPEGTGEGVYLQARAAALVDKLEIERALTLLAQRKNKSIQAMNGLFDGHELQIYKATTEKIWVNVTQEIGGKFVDERVEIQLN